ncbi:Xaa-Pro dipeptidase [Testudinibacter aquarius]|uniref:Xaa-Pro dipeptidase n=3 Tax=Testudinibacter aquarius TaxID=1524974 RepID=A0A4R3YB40_9PAST|nr:Xaa-Pro dipeptidase [Testudinibacter aquarius]KAE9531040.1 Xaa-Pro dipeptidase [Testudinibacter aquarius]TCV89150.1 Xaa-Pro dipeptidase [Testudinibacter aquarius]
MSNSQPLLFQQHLHSLQNVVQDILQTNHADGIWIYAGQEQCYFLDDQTKPFKINPLFNYFVPHPQASGSWLYLDGVNKPHLYFYQPDDYWYLHQPAPQAFWTEEFQWTILKHADEIKTYLGDPQHSLYFGEEVRLAEALGFRQINPQKALNYLHYQRSIKTEYEIACIYQAQFAALKGHQAAQAAFFDGQSEFEINLAYLQASQQSDLNVPYANIVAINQHSAVLHYTALQQQNPAQRLSFLLDAGASHLGYASDITRSYSVDPNDEFAEMIRVLEHNKLALIEQMQVGYNYLSYHTMMQQMIAQMLQDFELVQLPAEQIFEEGINRSFFPHGLGHFLGLQVHDVAGFQQNRRGTHKAPPEVYPSLRCTRTLAPNMVLTVEPGLYFIPLLLQRWRNHPLGKRFNWQKIEHFIAYGGIRTEDNIVIRANGAENLTQQALTALGG